MLNSVGVTSIVHIGDTTRLTMTGRTVIDLAGAEPAGLATALYLF